MGRRNETDRMSGEGGSETDASEPETGERSAPAWMHVLSNTRGLYTDLRRSPAIGRMKASAAERAKWRPGGSGARDLAATYARNDVRYVPAGSSRGGFAGWFVFCFFRAPRRMGQRRCACGAESGGREFWRCAPHRAEHGAGAIRAGVASERELLARLAFDFPDECSLDELVARCTFVTNAWATHDKVAYVAAAHGVDVGALAPLAPIAHREVQDLLASFLAFVARHSRYGRGLALACVERLRSWYPVLVRVDSRASMLYGERILRTVERATGTREFLVLADVALALRGRIGDAVECVYAAYLRSVRGTYGPIFWGHGRFVP